MIDDIEKYNYRIFSELFQFYNSYTPQMVLIQTALWRAQIPLHLDHFAVIDLPSENSGIPHLLKLFETLGFEVRGRDYLPSKQNDFVWCAEQNAEEKNVKEVLPQVVVADFRMDELPLEIHNIIKKYADLTEPLPKKLTQESILKYLTGRDWPLPTIIEYQTVKEFNELLAWVLVFGRRPNHFTLAAHLMEYFKNLNELNIWIQNLNLSLNAKGGVIKGGQTKGIAQSGTMDAVINQNLQDGIVQISSGFVEFVWRFPKNSQKIPQKWGDYFTDFVADQADKVVESLYRTT